MPVEDSHPWLGSDNTIQTASVQQIGRWAPNGADFLPKSAYKVRRTTSAPRTDFALVVFSLLKPGSFSADPITVAQINSHSRIEAEKPFLAETKMVLAGAYRPLSELEDLELRRHRLSELIELELVSPSLSEQIKKAVMQLDGQIAMIKQQKFEKIAA